MDYSFRHFGVVQADALPAVTPAGFKAKRRFSSDVNYGYPIS